MVVFEAISDITIRFVIHLSKSQNKIRKFVWFLTKDFRSFFITRISHIEMYGTVNYEKVILSWFEILNIIFWISLLLPKISSEWNWLSKTLFSSRLYFQKLIAEQKYVFSNDKPSIELMCFWNTELSKNWIRNKDH